MSTKNEKTERQLPRLFCPGDTFSNRTCSVPYDEIPSPLKVSYAGTKVQQGLFSQPYAAKGTPTNSAASLYKQEKKNREMCVKLS